MFHYLYIVLFCSFIHGHLGHFRLLAAVSMGVQISKYPDMELLDSYGNTVFHSSCFYIPASGAQRFQFLHIFTNTCLLYIPTSPHPYPLAHRPTHLTVAILMGALLSLKLDQWVGCAEPCGGHICSATTPDAYHHLGPRLQSCEPPTCLLKPACVLSPSSCPAQKSFYPDLPLPSLSALSTPFQSNCGLLLLCVPHPCSHRPPELSGSSLPSLLLSACLCSHEKSRGCTQG